MGGKRGAAVDYALTAKQFKAGLQAAAAVKDVEKSREAFALWLLAGRCGLRASELVHVNQDWIAPELPGLRLPRFQNCNCGTCRSRARKVAANPKETRSVKEIVEEEYFSPKSYNGHRSIPFSTRRTETIVTEYLEKWGYISVSYSTVYRRIVKIAYLAEGINGDTVTPQVLRATAATFWAGRGMESSILTQMFGWQSIDVADHYVGLSGRTILEEMNRIRDGGIRPALETSADPPTWEELRPDDPENLIDATWSLPEQRSAPDSPRYEEDDLIATELDDFASDGDYSQVPVVTGASSALAHTATYTAIVTADRLRREKEDFFAHPDAEVPTRRRAVAGVALYAVFVALLGVQFALNGTVFDSTTWNWAGPPTETAGLLIGTTLGTGNILRLIRRDFGL